MRYTHFVFDIDNTLINTTSAVLHSLQRALRDVTGIHREVGTLTPVLGIPGRDAFELLGIHAPEQRQKIYHLWETYEEEYQYTAYVYEGICPLLEYLDSKDAFLGIVTSKTYSQYCSGFQSLDLAAHFRTVVHADDTVRHKPDPEPLHEYMRRTGAWPEQILYIGDSTYDMQCAASAGVDGALALWGCHCPDGIHSAFRFDSPLSLMEWMREG